MVFKTSFMEDKMKIGDLVKFSSNHCDLSWIGVIICMKQGYCDVFFTGELGLATNLPFYCLEAAF